MADQRTMTREQVRQVDRRAVEALGIASIVLMENAAIRVSEVVLDLLAQAGKAEGEGRVAVLCGGGNNGGDGYAIARQLHNAGATATVYVFKAVNELDGDAKINAEIWRRMGMAFEVLDGKEAITKAATAWAKADVVVDALLGTGFHGQVREPMATAIDRVNELGKTVVAVDVPSGLDCQTGEISRATVRARVTVTFVARKTGFDVAGAGDYLGQVVVASIGVPGELIEAVRREVG